MDNANARDSGQWQCGFQLLCICLKKTVDDQAIIRVINQITQWDLFLQQVAWHRVTALLWRRLSALSSHLPDQVASTLKQDAHKTALIGMRHTHELQQLGSQFQNSQIPFLILKGVPLSHQLYGDVGVRFSRDIDILIKDDDIARVHGLLLSQGYKRIVPHTSLSATAMRYFHEFYKDFTYRHSDSGIILELHWRLGDHPHLLPMNSFLPFRNIQCYRMSGMEVPVLAMEHNVLYLMLHAAKASWARLSWLSDIAYLLSLPVDWEKVLILARRNGIEGITWVSVQATHRLLGAPLPVAFSADCYRPSLVCWQLLGQAERFLLKASYPGDIVYYFQDLFLSQKLRYRLYHLFYRGAFSLNDIALLPLPRYLFFLYPLLRPLLWVWRRIIPGSKDQVGFRHKG